MSDSQLRGRSAPSGAAARRAAGRTPSSSVLGSSHPPSAARGWLAGFVVSASLLALPAGAAAQNVNLNDLANAGARLAAGQAELIRARNDQQRAQADQLRAQGDFLRAQGQAQADVLRGTGEYQERTGHAMSLMETARATSIENGRKAFLYRHEIRQVAREARRMENQARLARVRQAREQLPDEPEHLSVAEYEPLSGTLNWPVLLLCDEYYAASQKIETLLNPRSAAGDERQWQLRRRQARQQAAELSERLKRDVRRIDTGEYVAARSFLKRLDSQLRAQAPLPTPATELAQADAAG